MLRIFYINRCDGFSPNGSGTGGGGGDVSGKEDITNKSTNVATDAASDTKYPSVKSVVTYFQQKLTDSVFGTFINSLTAKATPVDADSISVVDSADSNKQKKVSLSAFKTFLNYVVKNSTATLLDLLLTNQTASAGSRNIVNIDDTGKLIKQTWAVVDETNKKVTYTGLNTLATVLAQWQNSNLDSILKLYNDQSVEFGGSVSNLQVPAGITAGNAYFTFLDLTGEQYAFKDNASNRYLTFEKLSTGERIVRFKRSQYFDTGLGFEIIRKQTVVETTAAGSAQNVLFSITIPTNQALSLRITHAVAYSTDDSAVSTDGVLIFAKNAADLVTESNTAVTHQRLPNTLTANFNININGTSIEFRLQNEAAGKIYTVNVDYSYSLIARP